MLPLPWYYKWTESERFFHEIIQATVSPQREIELRPMLNDESKVETIIHSLVEAQAKSNQYLIFSNNDLIIKAGVYDALKPYIDAGNDMAFLNDDCSGSLGFVLLKVSQEVIGFWKTVNPSINKVSPEILASYPGSWAYLDHKAFTFTHAIDSSSPFVVLQLPSSDIGTDENLQKEFNMAERVFVSAQHMDIEPYMKHVAEDIIPFIYRFQEILIRSYQDAANS